MSQRPRHHIVIETDRDNPTVTRASRVYLDGQELSIVSYQINGANTDHTTTVLTFYADVEIRHRPEIDSMDPETFERLHTGTLPPKDHGQSPLDEHARLIELYGADTMARGTEPPPPPPERD